MKLIEQTVSEKSRCLATNTDVLRNPVRAESWKILASRPSEGAKNTPLFEADIQLPSGSSSTSIQRIRPLCVSPTTPVPPTLESDAARKILARQ